MLSKTENIINYYNLCEADYRMFWNLDHSLAMHAGFWDHSTKTLADALAKENEVLAELAEIKKEDQVLDAGCGVGGSSIYLAKRYGCKVTGITLSGQQVDKARTYAKARGVEDAVDFETMDFCHTDFPDASFDVVWGIESICHAQDKSLFVKEAKRLLKPGGRLVIADGFSVKEVCTEKQVDQMHRWLSGWGVDSLATKAEFESFLYSGGFSEVTYHNVTSHVMPSSKRLYWISFPAFVYSKIGELFGKRNPVQTQNICAAYYQYVTLKKGLWEYGFFKGKI